MSRYRNLFILLVLLVSNSVLLLPEGDVLRAAGAISLLLLPGPAWVEALSIGSNRFMRWAIGLGLSYALMIILGMLLHYPEGPILFSIELVLLNIITLGAVFWLFAVRGKSSGTVTWISQTTLLVLLIILLYGGLFRFVNLGYSEFQGDPVKAMVPAAEAIEGHEDALFFRRKKGPGEILIPMVLWRLTGLIDEATARTLFAVAGVMVILTTHVLVTRLVDASTGLIAAGLVGLNGFMVAFSRIVQYQEIVVWMSLLALLCMWEWRQEGRKGWLILVGIFFGIGVLAHYDTVLVGPALGYVFVIRSGSVWIKTKGAVVAGVAALAAIGLFFVPYLLYPQVTQASEYLGRRIDLDLSETSLYSFYFFTIFYNSIDFVLLVGGLALGFLVWALMNLSFFARAKWRQYAIALVAVIGVIGLAFWPDALMFAGIDLAFLPFTLIFVGALLSPVVNLAQRVLVLWSASAFLGYNFVIGDPRTHFYTIVVPMILVAALAGKWVWNGLAKRFNDYVPITVGLLLVFLFSGHLYLVYLRQSPEYETDWPESQSLLYWFPYPELSRYDTFGFVHKVGWKTVGGLYAEKLIFGDYQTNGLYEISDWYTRHQLRGCFRHSKNFLGVKYRLVDLRELPHYQSVGEVELPNNKGITIYQTGSAVESLGSLNVEYLNDVFDSTAWPAAFVQPNPELYSTDVNFAGAIRLTGYEVTVPRAQPGEYLSLKLHWQAQKEIPLDLDVFVHLEEMTGEEGAIWGQSNGSPACGEQPTSKWDFDETIVDSHTLRIDRRTPPGSYNLVAGMYLPQDNRRVPIVDEAGNPLADSVKLTTISIQLCCWSRR